MDRRRRCRLVLVAAVALIAFRPWASGGDTQQAIDESLPSPVGAAQTEEEPEPTSQAPKQKAKPEKSKAGKTPEATTKDQPTKKPAPDPEASQKPAPQPSENPKPQVRELGSGQFENAEYETNGTARIVELADGRRFLRLENFSTQQAPVIEMAFSNAPSGGEWGSYDDVRFEAVGTLKALSGNQNYEIPKGLDLRGFKSVVVWCDKYDVALGTAPVQL